MDLHKMQGQKMSTRSHIGYIKKDGSIVATYNHYDSNPSHLLKDLFAFINENGIEDFCNTIDRGGRRSGFRYFPDTFDGDDGDWTITDRADLGDDDIEFIYLFSAETGELVEAYDKNNHSIIDKISFN